MLNARVLSVTTLGLSLLVAASAVGLPGGTAHAAQVGGQAAERPDALPGTPGSRGDLPSEPVAEGPLLATGEVDPTAWDIPGEVVVDAKDDLDDGRSSPSPATTGSASSPPRWRRRPGRRSPRCPPTRRPSSSTASRTIRASSRSSRSPRCAPSSRPTIPLLKDQWHMERIGAAARVGLRHRARRHGGRGRHRHRLRDLRSLHQGERPRRHRVRHRVELRHQERARQRRPGPRHARRGDHRPVDQQRHRRRGRGVPRAAHAGQGAERERLGHHRRRGGRHPLGGRARRPGHQPEPGRPAQLARPPEGDRLRHLARRPWSWRRRATPAAECSSPAPPTASSA